MVGGEVCKEPQAVCESGGRFRTGRPGRSEPGVDAVRSGQPGDSWGRRLMKGEI